MFVKRTTVFLALLIMFSFTQSALSAATGKIRGKITDAVTGEPLIGANVVLESTSLGAAADMEGKYNIEGIPAGSYTLKISYIGYQTMTIKIEIKGDESLEQNFKLEPVGVTGKEIVVTAQASGQNAAINQQLASDKIVNVVSAARIQELPDANAAESVGRLPGISLIRNGGEGSGIVVRGLEPKYNKVLIDGVEMATTNTGDRGTDLSMISSNMLAGIEVSKTVTPDMDAAVLGGVVNFQIREARKTSTGGPEIDFLSQGGYKDIQNAYGNYKFAGSIGDRFLNDDFGVFVQGIVERVNLTADQLGGSYDIQTKKFGVPNPVILNSLNLSFNPRDRRRYDGTIVLDYKLPKGKIDLMNFFSKSDTKTETRSQNYNLSGNTITFGAGYSPNTLNVIQNILAYKQELFSIKMDAKLSHSYSENISLGNWDMNFLQISAGLNTIPTNEDPLLIAKSGEAKTNLDNMFFNTFNTSDNFLKYRRITGSIDLQKSITLSDLISGTIKIGGQYIYTDRWYNHEQGDGVIFFDGNADARKAILDAFPWMTQPPYNVNPNGTDRLPIKVFEDPRFSYGNFLRGNYKMGPGTNLGLIGQAIDIIKKIGESKPAVTSGDYSPNAYENIASDYSGNEYQNAGYIMAVVNIGSQITLIPGVRYQGLRTTYTAAHVPAAYNNNSYPYPFEHTDTTVSLYHGFWLPDISLKYKPFSWFDIRLAYTNTLSYPDYNAIIPRMDIFLKSVTWNNYLLEPSRSQNYDVQLSFYGNGIGLFTAGAFMKRLDKMLFNPGSITLSDPSRYPGLPDYTRGYTINTTVNNPNRINVWGAELEWQTHFWYLPDPFKGLVMNINYTHIFSKARYSFIFSRVVGYPPRVEHIDTTYTDRLINQPNDVVNLSLGYDFRGFSTRLSMIYQADVFNGTSFWPELRRSKDKYLRWDFSVKQDLPWLGLSAFFDINNLNSESDTFLVRGTGFPSSEQHYGLTADLGIRWKLQ